MFCDCGAGNWLQMPEAGVKLWPKEEAAAWSERARLEAEEAAQLLKRNVMEADSWLEEVKDREKNT